MAGAVFIEGSKTPFLDLQSKGSTRWEKEKVHMKQVIQTKILRALVSLALSLICFAFMQRVQAAEMDILPNGNTAYGSGAFPVSSAVSLSSL